MTATGRATPTDPAGTTANPTPGDDCGRCSPVNAASTNWPTIAPPPCTCNPWPTPRTPATSSPNRYGISPTRSGSRKGKRLAAPPHSPGRRPSTSGSPKASTSATRSTHPPSCRPATQDPDPDPDPGHPCGTCPGPYTRLRLGRCPVPTARSRSTSASVASRSAAAAASCPRVPSNWVRTSTGGGLGSPGPRLERTEHDRDTVAGRAAAEAAGLAAPEERAEAAGERAHTEAERGPRGGELVAEPHRRRCRRSAASARHG